MHLLALETSNDACSVALSTPHGMLEKFTIAPRRHAELLLPMIDEVLAEAGLSKQQLDAIAFGQGPGAFIGVRIAASATQGLALGLDLPVLPVSSLAAMAQAYRQQASHIIVANDARMNEVYFASYHSDCLGDDASAAEPCYVAPIDAECLLKPAQIDLQKFDLSQCLGIGSGWQAYAEQVSPAYSSLRLIDNVYPHAAQIAELGLRDWAQGVRFSAEQAQPLYIRNSVLQG